jgi:hypothetical protein
VLAVADLFDVSHHLDVTPEFPSGFEHVEGEGLLENPA